MLFSSAWDHANRPARRSDGTPTVLLVGQVHCRAIFRSILSQRGYGIFDASDVVEAITVARQVGPDLLLVELTMPGRDGWDAIRSFKSSADTYLIPAVAVSLATLPAGTYRRARSAGYVDYITRPLERRHVIEVAATWTRSSEHMVA